MLYCYAVKHTHKLCELVKGCLTTTATRVPDRPLSGEQGQTRPPPTEEGRPRPPSLATHKMHVWLWRLHAPTSPLLCVRTTAVTSVYFHTRTNTKAPPQENALLVAQMEVPLVFLVEGIAEYHEVCASVHCTRSDSVVINLPPRRTQCSFCYGSHPMPCEVIGCRMRVCASCTRLAPGHHPDAPLKRVCPQHAERHDADGEFLEFRMPVPSIA